MKKATRIGICISLQGNNKDVLDIFLQLAGYDGKTVFQILGDGTVQRVKNNKLVNCKTDKEISKAFGAALVVLSEMTRRMNKLNSNSL